MSYVYEWTYYRWYRYAVTPAGVGSIVQVWAAPKRHVQEESPRTGDWEYLGSYFSQEKVVPRGSAYNMGPNSFHEVLRNA